MSIELAKEMAEAAHDVLIDAIRDYARRWQIQPSVLHVTPTLEKLLITYLTLSANIHFSADGVRGMPHYMGMRLVFDASAFKLDGEPRNGKPLPAAITKSVVPGPTW